MHADLIAAHSELGQSRAALGQSLMELVATRSELGRVPHERKSNASASVASTPADADPTARSPPWHATANLSPCAEVRAAAEGHADEIHAGEALANWGFLADRAAALGSDQPPPAPPARRSSTTRADMGARDASDVSHHRGSELERTDSSATAPPLLRDVCAMLRVGRAHELIPVLGEVIRVAVTVPQLEELRRVVACAAQVAVTSVDEGAAVKEHQLLSTMDTGGMAAAGASPSSMRAELPAASRLAPLLERWGRELKLSRAFEAAVGRLVSGSGTGTGGAGPGCKGSRARLLLLLRERLRQCESQAVRPASGGVESLPPKHATSTLPLVANAANFSESMCAQPRPHVHSQAACAT